MATPNRMLEIEQEFGEKRRTLLPRILNEEGSMENAARRLRISVRNLTTHCEQIGVVKDAPRWHLRDEAESAESCAR